MNDENGRRRPLLGPWRMLDLARATMPMRLSVVGMAAALPQFGPPDEPEGTSDPAQELPASNITDWEQSQAVQRERARRFLRERG